ncbi:MarR family winged helix-turn-helix transcriptional regulator [Mycetocola reblochoni]|uniref:Organic hydroperoxide resistance transcriptional regulator n=2 Tax=Mycetocola reblochoni TaxID=331618 RepID=A0A1R4IXF3_9MICO|nr:MarR family transcriptional regulator [Mycetocola reblochoni]RLP70979.1 MarR family transcriptional regulator [Mycetocola reblochoni]SJN24003.1 Organic hydroperoxide resistance transcriptional regulator [Mycetocola reblochoni REB411]
MTQRDDLLRLENQLCFSAVLASRAIVSAYRPLLDPLGLTHPQYLVLLALWERDPRTVTELARELRLDKATLSPLVKRLEASGYVTRRRNSDDERVLDVRLTGAGRALRDSAAEIPAAIMARLGMDEGRIGQLRDSFDALTAAAMEETAPTGQTEESGQARDGTGTTGTG